MELIERKSYTDRILHSLGKGLIIALTGQRRVGKSSILKLLRNTLTQNNNNVIYINKDKDEFHSINDNKSFSKYVAQHLSNDKNNYLLVDEIQNIESFELTLRSLQADNECDIVITGSNSKILSSELSTYLAGRFVEIHIQSLSYNEFLSFQNIEDSQESIISYLDLGGLPQLRTIGLNDIDFIDDYLQDVRNTVVLKDIIERYKIRNITLLNNLIEFISDNIGKPISATNIARYLKSQRIDTTAYGVLNYINYLCSSFIINRVKRYDIHGKRLFESNEKYYFEDLGIRNSIMKSHHHVGDIEKLIENAIYLHLRNMGYVVYVGQLRNTEIDFIAQKRNRTIYIQATYLLASQETIEREFGNLKLIKDNHPKYVVSLDNLFEQTNDNGIIHINLRKFLQLSDL